METAFNLLIGLCTMGLFGWLAWRIARASLKRSDEPAALGLKWVVSAVLLGGWVYGLAKFAGGPGMLFMVPITCVVFLILGIMWAPTLGKTLFAPLTNTFDGGSVEPDPTPFYAMAEAKKKRGRYDEAIADIRVQLADFPNDMQGHMLLAEILAEHKGEVDEAVELLEYFVVECDPGAVNGSFVLNRLADFHLKYRKDPAMARQCLQRVQYEFPGTEQADKAAQRIAHLQDDDFLTKRKEPKKFEVKKNNLKLGLAKDSSAVQAPKENLEVKAHQMVEHLTKHPQDSDVREQLAWLYAEHYGKIDWAIDQLRQLTQMSHQSPAKLARWYNQIADVYCRFTGSSEAAKLALEEYIERFPENGHAIRMQERLKRLKLEARTSKKSRSMETGPSIEKLGMD